MKLDNESVLREILEHSLAGYWDWDIPSGYEYMSPAFKKMFGYEVHEMPDRADSWQKLIFEEDLPSVFKRFDEHVKSKGTVPYYNEVRYHHKNGSTVWVICTGKVIEWNETGEPLRMVGCHVDISKRKKAEEQASNVSRQITSILSSVSDAFFSLDNDVVITYFNDAAENALGRLRHEVLGRKLFDAFPEARGSIFDLNYTKALNEKQLICFETYFGISPYENWYDVKVYPFENGISVFFQVITERKKNEITLSERNRFIESLVNMTPDVLYIYDIVDKVNVYSNDGIQRILGYSALELQAMGSNVIAMLMHPDDFSVYMEKTISRYTNAKDGELVIHQYRMKHRSGSWRWLTSSESVYKRLSDGSPKQIFGLVHDVTESKYSETMLCESESRFRSVFEQSPVGSVFVGLDKRFIKCNKAFCSFLGYTENELIGKLISDVTFPDDIEIGMKELKLIIDNKLDSFTAQKRYIRKDDVVVWGEISISLVRDVTGKPLYFLPVIKDITDRKKTEEEHSKYDQQLQLNQKLESLGILAGGIAHDFNNLLGGIYGYIDMAVESTSDSLVSQYLSKTLNTIERARALTLQLLTFAKGGAPIQKIASLFPFVEETAQFALSGSNVSCRFDIAAEIWNCNYDRNQIGQVIDNIVINAVQAMSAGGTMCLKASNVTLSENEHPLLKNGDYVKLSVKDYGIGIPKEFLPRIFDPFFTTKSKGHGLGLATCYSIINRHGGCIDVESEPGKGSTFHVYLPATHENAQSTEKNIRIMYKGSGTFLVMDDEVVMRETIGEMLSSFGYNVVCKENGTDAINYVISALRNNHDISGMIFDLTIPGGMGGKDAAVEIRKINSTIPIFVVSGYADDPIMKNPVDYGFNASICKPFRKSELTEMLSKYL